MYTKQLRGHMSWKETSIFSRYEHILTHARHHMMSKQFSVYARARYQATAVSNKYIRVFLLWFPLALKHFVYALQREVYDGSLDVGVRLIFQFVWKDELNSYWNESIGRARAQYFFSIPFARSCQQKKKKKKQQLIHRHKYELRPHELVSWLIFCYCFFFVWLLSLAFAHSLFSVVCTMYMNSESR